LVAYIPDRNPDVVDNVFSTLFGLDGEQAASMGNWTAKHVRYSPMMRFVLRDADERLFEVQRWCFRGSIDGWICLDGPASLPMLVDKYAPHLGHESFFELR